MVKSAVCLLLMVLLLLTTLGCEPNGGDERSLAEENIRHTINALMQEQRDGNTGADYWLFGPQFQFQSPTWWSVLEISRIEGHFGKALVQVDSSEGGTAVRKAWTFNMVESSDGWKVAAIAEA